MPWTTAHTQLRDLLSELYDTPAAARTMVSESQIDVLDFAFEGAIRDIWRGIIAQTDTSGDLSRIIATASARFKSRRPELERLEQQFLAAKHGRIKASAPSSAHSAKPPVGVHILDSDALFAELRRNLDHWRQYVGRLAQAPPAPSREDTDYSDADVCLNKIREARINPKIIELSGPAGIGKSYLKKIVFGEVDLKRHGTEYPARWKYCEAHPRTEAGTPATFSQVMEEFTRQFSGSVIKAETWAQSLGQAIQRAFKREPFDRIIFWIDDADRLSDEVLAQLIGDGGPVGGQVREYSDAVPRNVIFRLVVATRQRCLAKVCRCHCPELSSLVFPLWLDSFQLGDVIDMIGSRIPDMVRTAGSTKADDMAGAIYSLTGGHPGATNHILQKLDEVYSWGLASHLYYDTFHKDVLGIIMRDIIGEMNEMEFFFYYTMSVFRTFAHGQVRHLIDAGLLPKELVSENQVSPEGIEEWLLGLTEAPALIGRPPVPPALLFQESYKMHHVLRHYFQLDRTTTNQQCLAKLHGAARRYYDAELRQRDSDNIRFSLSASCRAPHTLEALYHAAREEWYETPLEQRAKLASSWLIGLAAEYGKFWTDAQRMVSGWSGPTPAWLSRLWREDAELKNLICQYPDGKRTWEAIDQIMVSTASANRRQGQSNHDEYA